MTVTVYAIRVGAWSVLTSNWTESVSNIFDNIAGGSAYGPTMRLSGFDYPDSDYKDSNYNRFSWYLETGISYNKKAYFFRGTSRRQISRFFNIENQYWGTSPENFLFSHEYSLNADDLVVCYECFAWVKGDDSEYYYDRYIFMVYRSIDDFMNQYDYRSRRYSVTSSSINNISYFHRSSFGFLGSDYYYSIFYRFQDGIYYFDMNVYSLSNRLIIETSANSQGFSTPLDWIQFLKYSENQHLIYLYGASGDQLYFGTIETNFRGTYQELATINLNEYLDYIISEPSICITKKNNKYIFVSTEYSNVENGISTFLRQLNVIYFPNGICTDAGLVNSHILNPNTFDEVYTFFRTESKNLSPVFLYCYSNINFTKLMLIYSENDETGVFRGFIKWDSSPRFYTVYFQYNSQTNKFEKIKNDDIDPAFKSWYNLSPNRNGDRPKFYLYKDRIVTLAYPAMTSIQSTNVFVYYYNWNDIN